jgi:type II secretory pathway pseudopilin PulG
MHNCKREGLTLIESLVSILLLSALLVSLLGAFFVSKVSAVRARHRIAAMDMVKEYMEQEIRAEYLGGYVDGDYYVMVSSAAPTTITIDDRGTPDPADDLLGTIEPSPYPAVTAAMGSVYYKTVGFIVRWNEESLGGTPPAASTERAVTYVSQHS